VPTVLDNILPRFSTGKSAHAWRQLVCGAACSLRARDPAGEWASSLVLPHTTESVPRKNLRY
jgi:hypothetical protein